MHSFLKSNLLRNKISYGPTLLLNFYPILVFSPKQLKTSNEFCFLLLLCKNVSCASKINRTFELNQIELNFVYLSESNDTVLTYAQRVALGIDYLLNVTRIVIFYSKRTKHFVITILVVIQIMSNLTLQIL